MPNLLISTLVLTCVEPCVLLHMGQLLEPPGTVGALVGLLASVDADVLNKLKCLGLEL